MRRNEDREEFEPMNLALRIGAAIILALLLLVLIQFASVDAYASFGLLLLGMAITALVLVRRSYTAGDRALAIVPEATEKIEGKNALETTIENLELAFQGDPYSQILAWQELKELLIDRLALRKHMSRSEVMDMASDHIWLEAEVDQADLRLLLTKDLKETDASVESISFDQASSSVFPDRFKGILALVEEM